MVEASPSVYLSLPYRHSMVPPWLPHGKPMVTQWLPNGYPMVTQWLPYGYPTVTLRLPYGYPLVTPWLPPGYPMVPGGYPMGTLWVPYGYHIPDLEVSLSGVPRRSLFLLAAAIRDSSRWRSPSSYRLGLTLDSAAAESTLTGAYR
ncbi:hypothetical protein FOCC_FOCC011025, partial [Frankliniella occidentalis]